MLIQLTAETASPDATAAMALLSLLDAAAGDDDLPPVMAAPVPCHDRDAALFVGLGHALARRGEGDAALAAFEVALTFAPEADVLVHACRALRTLAGTESSSAPTSLRDAAAPGGFRLSPDALLN